MSPVRNVSQHLGDMMHRSEERGALRERERLRLRAQALHTEAGHGQPGSDIRSCSDPVCAALSELLADPEA